MTLLRTAGLLFFSLGLFAQPYERFTIQGPIWPYVGEIGDTFFLFPDQTGPGAYRWDFGDGRSSERATPEITYTIPGVFKVTLTYTHEDGSESQFQRWLFVNDPAFVLDFQNEPPHPFINAPAPGAALPVNQEICFQGHGIDPEGEAVTLYWDFDDGDLRSHETHPKKQYHSWGGFFPKLFVRDATGYVQSNLAFLELHLYAETAPPNGVILKPQADDFAFNQQLHQVSANQPVCLSAAVNDVEDLSGYSAFWNVLGESQQSFTGFNPDPEIWPAGFYDVFLDVSDPNGLFDPIVDQVTVWVRDDNRAPQNVTIAAPNYELIVETGTGVGLSGLAEDLDGDALTYLWDVGDGRMYEGQYVDQISYSQAGLYQISLTVEDGMGGSSRAHRSTWVRVIDPTAGCEYDAPQLIAQPEGQPIVAAVVGMNLRFSVALNPQEGEQISDIFWDFSHGIFADGAQPGPIAFSEPGFYPVRAFAQNQCGLWTVLEAWSVFVSAAGNLAPDGQIISPIANGRNNRGNLIAAVPVGGSITPIGQATDTDGQTPLSTLWLLDDAFYAGGDNPEPITLTDTEEHLLQYFVQDAAGNNDPFPAQILIKGIDPTLEPQTDIILPDGDIVALPGESLVFEALGQDPNGLFLEYDWDFGPAANRATASGKQVSGIIFDQPSPAGQPYEVSVRARTPFTTQSTPTTVRITVKQFADSELEPNNSLQQAASVQRGSYRNLTLEDGDDADVYRFQVDVSGRDLEINLSSDGEALPTLYRFLNNSWTPVALSLDNAATGGLVIEAVEAGEYALEVKPAAGAKMGLSYSMGIATLLPSLYLPFIVEDGNLESNLGIINPTAATAALSLTGLGADGRTVAEIALDLAPGNRLSLSSDLLFPQENAARDVRWVRVRSSTRLIGYTNTASVDKTQLMSSGALTSLAPGITVPHIADPNNGWYTRAILINALETTGELNFQAPNSQTKIADMAGYTQSDFRFSETLQGGLPGWGSFNSGETPGLAGLEIFGRVDDRRTFAAIEMAHNSRNNPNFTYVDNTIYYTHIAADVTNWWTGISLINLSGGTTSYQITGYDSQGTVTAEVGGSLEAGGKLLRTARALFGDADVDWVRVQSDGAISGFELFGSHELNRMAGFNATGRLADTLYFPHVEPTSPETWTGISILNVADQAVELTLSAVNDNGVVGSRTTRSLGPRTKLVQTAQALFADVGYPADTTYIRVEASAKTLTGFELFGTLDPQAGGLGELLAGLAAQAR